MSQDRYQELKLLGQGGFAEVCLAEDQQLGRQVALKRPLPDVNELPLEDFLEEAKKTSRLEHPCIPTLYDLGTDSQGRPYLSLQLIRGKTLEQCIRELREGCPKAHAQYPFSQRVAIAVKVCEAVAYAHERGFLHRDLKPANIMVGELGEVYVLDWGLAKLAGVENPGSGEYFKGTPLYARARDRERPARQSAIRPVCTGRDLL
ncbi:serine/threonine protein kinase [bacterium]|nr:serine/threonine protein kinase [bacterium]